MLFSNDQVAESINRGFEPAWQSVRPCPMVRIDFGNGTVVNRTLHGNIATYVCAADAQVLDILPGIYAPAVYLERLEQLRALANQVVQIGAEKRGAWLEQYHQRQLTALKQPPVPAETAYQFPPVKSVVENPVRAVASGGGQSPAAATPALPDLTSAADVANWKVLAEDTRLNETVRRQQIHTLLAQIPSVRPDQVTRWLYKEVLHADLDDPYLGLGSVLFTNYPFAKEDQPR